MHSHDQHAKFKISKTNSSRKSLQCKLQLYKYKTHMHSTIYRSASAFEWSAHCIVQWNCMTKNTFWEISWIKFIPAGFHACKHTHARFMCIYVWYSISREEMKAKRKTNKPSWTIISYSKYFQLISLIQFAVLFCRDVLI